MIIKDKALEPFSIEISRYGYTLHEEIKRKDKKGNFTIYEDAIGFYVNLESLINEIIMRKIEGDATLSLKEFIKLYKQESDEIKKALK